MILDAHLHCTGQERADDVLRSLDKAGIDMAVLLAPFLSEGYSLHDPASLRRGNEHLARLVRGHEDRLIGFAVVDPRQAESSIDLRRAVDSGLRGVKMVPTGWYPYDDAVQPLFATAHELGLPLLFHSGIFIDGRSGRFCRPAFFEALREYPGLKVTLAHLGWPWCDEAIAVGLIELIHGVAPDRVMFRFDISFGPPARLPPGSVVQGTGRVGARSASVRQRLLPALPRSPHRRAQGLGGGPARRTARRCQRASAHLGGHGRGMAGPGRRRHAAAREGPRHGGARPR